MLLSKARGSGRTMRSVSHIDVIVNEEGRKSGMTVSGFPAFLIVPHVTRRAQRARSVLSEDERAIGRIVPDRFERRIQGEVRAREAGVERGLEKADGLGSVPELGVGAG